MIYLEDIAVEVKTKKYKNIRNITCGILLFMILVEICKICGTYKLQSDAIEKNKITIAEYENKVSALEKEIEEYTNEVVNTYYDVTEIGDKVAMIQSKYGGFDQSVSIAEMSESAKNTASDMDTYLESGDGRTAWYQNMTCDYQWYYLMRQTSTIDQIPCIWVCKSNTNTLLAVTTGMCDASSERFGNFKTYYTTQGNALISEDTVINISGVIEANVDYEEHYENVKNIQEIVADKAGLNAESSSEGTITGSINITIEETGE